MILRIRPSPIGVFSRFGASKNVLPTRVTCAMHVTRGVRTICDEGLREACVGLSRRAAMERLILVRQQDRSYGQKENPRSRPLDEGRRPRAQSALEIQNAGR